MSAEPSMEDILSSIKRIIAEEQESPAARRRPVRAPARPLDEDDDEVLELSDRLGEVRPFELRAAPEPEPRRTEEPRAEPEPIEDARMAEPKSPAEPKPAPILSPSAEQASRGSLEALSRLVVKPGVAGGDTLEGLVREMLRPMLRDWLDANLPAMVEDMVSREITRITGRE